VVLSKHLTKLKKKSIFFFNVLSFIWLVLTTIISFFVHSRMTVLFFFWNLFIVVCVLWKVNVKFNGIIPNRNVLNYCNFIQILHILEFRGGQIFLNDIGTWIAGRIIFEIKYSRWWSDRWVIADISDLYLSEQHLKVIFDYLKMLQNTDK
jgi:hypothetical protein